MTTVTDPTMMKPEMMIAKIAPTGSLALVIFPVVY